MTLAGFPHSGTPGSTPTCGSPRLFAACRALLRLSVPRHPPCALVRLTGSPRYVPLKDVESNRSTDSQNITRWCSRAFPSQGKLASNTTPNSHDPSCQSACSRHHEIAAEPVNLNLSCAVV